MSKIVESLRQRILAFVDMRSPTSRGGDLGGNGGTVPPKFEVWGGGLCIRPPNIFRSSVVGRARKYEQSKQKMFSCEERVI